MQLSGYDYLRDRPNPDRGLARLAPKIESLRAESPSCLLFDNGDFIQGTPLADTAMADLRNGVPHPMIAALNALKYDAITLGNHEFDYGLDNLALVLEGCDMPVVCANVRTSPSDHLVPPWTIIRRALDCDDGGIRTLNIGVIGFVTPQITEWNRHLLDDRIVTDDIVNAAKTHVGALRRAGADIVVALCHAGIGAVTHSAGMENAAAPLAALLGIDIVMAGHTHSCFPSGMIQASTAIDIKNAQVYGKPFVMAGFDGMALGVIDLDLGWSDDNWVIEGHNTRLVNAKDSPVDTEHPVARGIFESTQAPHRATRKDMSTEIAQTNAPLNSHFTMVGVDPMIRLVGQAHMSYALKMLAEKSFGDLPVLGAVSSFRAGGHGGPDNFIDLSNGAILKRDVGAIAPFNNPICAVLRRGWQLKRWLEFAAGYFLQIKPGMGAQPMICPQLPSYHFDWLIGLTYAFDLTSPARFDEVGDVRNFDACRVKNLCYEGKPVQDEDLFVVATSVYRAHGGGGNNPIQSHDILQTSHIGAADILTNFLTNSSSLSVSETPVWGFEPIQDACGVFRTSPAASSGAVPDGVSRLAETPDGFDAYAYTF